MGLDKFTQKMMDAQIPRRYRSRSVMLEDLAVKPSSHVIVRHWIKHLPDHLRNGQGLLVVGTAKQTHLICVFAARMGCLNRILSYYISMSEIREAMFDRRVEHRTEYPLEDWLCTVPLLCVVDFGVEPMNDRWVGRLFQLFSHRHDYDRATVVGTVLAPADITARYGANIKELLKDNFTTVGLS